MIFRQLRVEKLGQASYLLGCVRAKEGIVVDPIADRRPAIERSFEPVLLDPLDGAIHRDPGHHLGVGEVPRRAAHFPDAAIRFVPVRFEELDERMLDAPRAVGRRSHDLGDGREECGHGEAATAPLTGPSSPGARDRARGSRRDS